MPSIQIRAHHDNQGRGLAVPEHAASGYQHRRLWRDTNNRYPVIRPSAKPRLLPRVRYDSSDILPVRRVHVHCACLAYFARDRDN